MTNLHISQLPDSEHSDEPSSDADQLGQNVAYLQVELGWLLQLVEMRLAALKDGQDVLDSAPLPLPASLQDCAYQRFLDENKFGIPERLSLILCFAAFFQPDVLHPFLDIDPFDRRAGQLIGGKLNRDKSSFKPTLQTLLFLLSGGKPSELAKFQLYFHPKHRLFKEEILHLESPKEVSSYPQEREIRLDLAYGHHFLNGEAPEFDQEENFPAQRLQTDKTFKDLVLSERIRLQLKSPMDFVRHRKTLFDNSDTRGKLHHGYVVMLYGPPGTGKTLTASVIGQELGVEVYSINLARVISKYIGETEKNLERVFDRLENKNCILFFDEADALFGKRTDISEAKDRYANQEVAYLLQKIETCQNLVILSTNFRQNLDEAFQRRILSYIKIDTPRQTERLQLWTNMLPPSFEYASEEVPQRLAEDYQLTGANIGNILKLTCLDAVSKGNNVLEFKHIEYFTRQEFIKENRIFQVMKDRGNDKSVNRYSMESLGKPAPDAGSPTGKPQNVYEAMSHLIAKRKVKEDENKNGHGI